MYTVQDLEEAHRIHFLLRHDPSADQADVVQAGLNADYIVTQLLEAGEIVLVEIKD